MSISTELQIKRIRQYKNLLLKIYDLEMQVSILRDDLRNLAVNMTQEDINEANELLARENGIGD